MKIREYVILFTEDCPLNCTYCNLKRKEDYYKSENISYDEIDNLLYKYSLEDQSDYSIQIAFTGGEPFLYFNDIKKLMLKYGNIFSYKFYTSGYLLTKDILKFLINYRTSFLLSVDGPEYITDKIRPTNDPKAESYYKRMEKVFPELLFYFPTVEWKTIIIKEYIDEVFNIYLEAENRGFNFIKFVLDFQTPDWEKEELERLKFQFSLIQTHIIFQVETNKRFLQITNMNDFILNAFKQTKFSPEYLICQLFSGRKSISPKGKIDHYCMSSYFNSLEECEDLMIQELSNNNKCLNDKECDYFNFCFKFSCPKNSYDDNKIFFKPRKIECYLFKIIGDFSINLLHYGNINLQNNEIWISYLNNRISKGG